MRRHRPPTTASRAGRDRRALLAPAAAAALALSGGCHLISGLDDLVVTEGPEPTGGGGQGGAGNGTAGSAGSGGDTTSSTSTGPAMCGGEVCAEAACCGGACIDITAAPNCGACGNDCIGGRACEEGPAGSVCGPTWVKIATEDAINARRAASTAWLGDVMFIWGGRGNTTQDLRTGALLDPRMDIWTQIITNGAPSRRAFAAAVWTGAHVIVWGGGHWSDEGVENDGGRYVPSSDEWLPMTDSGAPPGRRSPIAVWTGIEMLIWGGEDSGGPVEGGARYDEGQDAWTPISDVGAPPARSGAAWAWTGTELLLFGGRPGGSGATDEGYAYHPATDTWRALPKAGAPSARYDAFGVWMGGRFLVMGGRSVDSTLLASAAQYDPTRDAWLPVADAPDARAAAGVRSGWAGWNGIYALFQGGLDVTSSLRLDGVRYHPPTDEWTVSPAFATAKQHEWGAASWTGQELVVWSGLDGGELDTDGERGQP